VSHELPHTRRALVARTLAGSAALALLRASAGTATPLTVPTIPSATTTSGNPPTDTDVLSALLLIERVSVFSYAHVLASIALDHRARGVIRGFAGHERVHAATIAAELRTRGGSAPPRPRNATIADEILDAVGSPGRLAHVHNQADAIRFLVGLETVAEGAYYKAIAWLADPRLLAIAAQIMANQAQHEMGLRILVPGFKAIDYAPTAFVSGRH
jgi:hypothetical protein